MSTPSILSDTEHQALQDLLPWYASGALGEAEAGHVQEHLPGCAVCRKELAWQRKLLETEGPLPAGLDPERALARLLPQLDGIAASRPALQPEPVADAWPQATQAAGASTTALAASSAAPPGLGQRLRDWLAGVGWQGWAMGAQCAAIAVLATLQLLPRGEAPAYQALGRGPAATPDILVVFKPDVRLQDIQGILQANGAQIIGGPTVTNAYMLDVDPGRQAQLLSALRANPSVETAESLTAGSQP